MPVDRFGNVFFSQHVARDDGTTESEITKLNANGTRRWQIRFHDGGPHANWPTGLVPDERGNVYLATADGEHTTIVKFAEHGAVR